MSAAPLRIAFLGLNAIGRRVRDWLLAQGEEVVARIDTREDLSLVRELTPDLVISGGFRHIVPADLLDVPRLGFLNMHKSLLPYNRGANPNVWTILEHTPAGVTIHRMDAGIDTGPILAQREIPVSFADTGKTLYARLEQAQFELFTEFWPRFRAGQVTPVPQQGRGTYHEIKDFKALRSIDPDRTTTARELLDLLRAMSFPPFDNCHLDLDGERYHLRLEVSRGRSGQGSLDGSLDGFLDDETEVRQYGR